MASADAEKQEDPLEAVKANTPLPFPRLKSLDPSHEYLARRGFSQQAMEVFGVGYFTGSRGLMKGLAAIPIHNPQGELVAYAGKSPDEEMGAGGYTFPDTFRKDLELYNIHRAVEAVGINERGLIVVADFFDVFRLHEAGYENAVALMGDELSDAQLRLIFQTIGGGGKVSLVLSKDNEGFVDILAKLLGLFYVRLWRTESPPSILTEKDIRSLLG